MNNTLGVAYLVRPVPIDPRAPGWEDRYYRAFEPKKPGRALRLISLAVVIGAVGLFIGALQMWA